jgi:hypothetical protein
MLLVVLVGIWAESRRLSTRFRVIGSAARAAMSYWSVIGPEAEAPGLWRKWLAAVSNETPNLLERPPETRLVNHL